MITHKFYGFILRYPQGKEDITGAEYEPWHYRYVGTENAKIIYEKQICLEEFIKSTEKQKNLQEFLAVPPPSYTLP